MHEGDFKNLIQDIIYHADFLKKKFIKEPAPVNYACIFCQNEKEYILFTDLAGKIGKVIQKTKSGPLFQIKPLVTVAGDVQLLKIREPDPIRTERGDADFTLQNYNAFKKTHLGKDGFSLIKRDNFEMLELIENDYPVRVYFSNPPLDRQLNIQ